MNRYDDVSVARFNPLSMQEVMMVPMMKRKQHDELAAQQEILRQGLANVDPHDKYYDEALRIKNELNNKITSQAELLAKEGINPNTQQNFIKLNREYQDTTSPTGKLGQINAHKVNLQKTYQDYVKRSIDAGNTPLIAKMHAEQALQKHMQDPLYDERGRVIDYNISKDPAKYIDIPKRVQEYATAAGFSSTEWAKSAGALSYDSAGNRFVINQKGSGLTQTNRENLRKVAETLNNEISDPSSEVRQSIDYTFKDPNKVWQDVQTQLGIYREDKKSSEQGFSYDSVNWADANKAPSGPGTAIAEKVSLKESVEKALKNLERFETSPRSIPNLSTASGIGGYNEGSDEAPAGVLSGDEQKKVHFENSLTKDEQKMYIETYRAKVAQGKIPKGKDMYSNEAIQAVKDAWKTRQNFNFTNNIMLPDSREASMLNPPSLDRTYGKDLDAYIGKRVDVARKNRTQVIFDVKGKSINIKDKKDFKLVGVYNPANILPAFGGNPDNTISPYVVSFTNDKGEQETALMPRDFNEIKGSREFIAAKLINKTVSKSATNANDFTTFSSKQNPELKYVDLSMLGIEGRGVDGMRVKYDPNKDNFTLEIIRDGKSQKTNPLTSQEYQMLMYDMYDIEQ